MKSQQALRRFAYACLLFCAALVFSQTARTQEIALTFDDLPAHGPLPDGVTRIDVVNQILAALRASGTPPVYGFVIGGLTRNKPENMEVLDIWRKAGYPLGNHTWSHLNLNSHTPEQFEFDLQKEEPLLAAEMGNADWHWLRFPYLLEGKDPQQTADIRAFLADHGYKIAAVTMSFNDYLWNEPYARCQNLGDTAKVQFLEQDYLQTAKADAEDRRAMAKAAFGHDIPYVLLMHAGAFDAHMLPRLLQQYREMGFHFVSLQAAEKDPFYANDLDLTLPGTPDTLAAADYARHVNVQRHAKPSDQLSTICR